MISARSQQNAFRDIQSRGMMAFSDYGQVTGNGLADLLLGFITYSGGARLDNPQYLRTRSWNFFVQDSYRIRPNVTLQLGLRHEYNAPPVDRYDRANTYDPADAVAGWRLERATCLARSSSRTETTGRPG